MVLYSLCVFCGIRLICDDLHRLATYRLFVITCKGSARCARLQSLATEGTQECRAELARAMLSRSLHSYSQLLVCEYKGTKKNNVIQDDFRLFS